LLLSKAVQERKAEEENFNSKAIENLQVSCFLFFFFVFFLGFSSSHFLLTPISFLLLWLQINSLMRGENIFDEDFPASYRAPSTYGEEYLKYLQKAAFEQVFEEESDPIIEHINLVIKSDKRFLPEVNEEIKTELKRRVHELKYKIFTLMLKKQQRITTSSPSYLFFFQAHLLCFSPLAGLNKLGVFNEETNRIRIRSLFKVELQRFGFLFSFIGFT
jgi:hypothetical protein